MTHSVTQLKVAAMLALLALSSGCTSLLEGSAAGPSVQGAFLSPNAVVMQPYTRTIFSSNNF